MSLAVESVYFEHYTSECIHTNVEFISFKARKQESREDFAHKLLHKRAIPGFPTYGKTAEQKKLKLASVYKYEE